MVNSWKYISLQQQCMAEVVKAFKSQSIQAPKSVDLFVLLTISTNKEASEKQPLSFLIIFKLYI